MKRLSMVLMLVVAAGSIGVFGQGENTYRAGAANQNDKNLVDSDGNKKSQITDNADDLSPIIRIVSPIADSRVSVGEGFVGSGSPNGSGFALNLEIVTRNGAPVAVNESLNIRNTALLGSPNPNIPGLTVVFDTDLVKPDGGIIPRNTNLAALFNIAGTDDTPGGGVTVWLGWHVLESLRPGLNSSRPLTITVSITDTAGRIASDSVRLQRQRFGATSGQALTPAPMTVVDDGIDDLDGPEVTMIAPRVPTRVSTGPQTGNPSPPASGALFFVQVTALDRFRHGIGVSENGQGTLANSLLGTILDGSQIENPNVPTATKTNRNYPGLKVTFDVPLRQPNGNVVPAGSNLAPIFNIAGSETSVDGFIVTTADWVVGGSLVMPAGKSSVTITARVTDNLNRTRSVSHVVGISPVENGQNLTPQPAP